MGRIQVALSPRVDTDPLPGGTSYAEDYSIPVIYWDEDIEVNAIKCVKDTEGVVQTRGTVSWISDFPPGKIIEAGVGSGPRGPGCVNYVYMNTIPDAVKVELGQLKAEGVDSTEWHLTGSEIPISEDGEEGTPRSWTTTSFRIIHENAPKEQD